MDLRREPTSDSAWLHDGEILDPDQGLLQLEVERPGGEGFTQLICVFTQAPEWRSWTVADVAGVSFRPATRQQAKKRLNEILLEEAGAFRSAPADARWLGVVPSDGYLRLIVTFSRDQAPRCLQLARFCFDECRPTGQPRALVEQLVEYFNRATQRCLCTEMSSGTADTYAPVQSPLARVALPVADENLSPIPRAVQIRKLSTVRTAELANFAERTCLGLETVVIAAWVHLLRSYSEQDAVPVYRRVTRQTEEGRADRIELAYVPATSRNSVADWLHSVSAVLADSGSPLDLDAGIVVADSVVVVSSGPESFLVKLLEECDGRLILQVRNDGPITISASYDAGRFSADFIEILLLCLANILEQLPSSARQALPEIALIPPGMQSLFVSPDPGATSREQNDILVHELFEQQAEASAQEVAAIFNESHITYKELNERANQLARYIARFGTGPEAVIGIHLPRSIDLLVALFGILKSGGAYLPLDISLPAARVQTILSESRAPIVITSSQLAGGLEHCQARIICIDAESRVIERESPAKPESGVRPENLAYVIYTSGSTGRPKGVMVEHRQLVASFAGMDQMFGTPTPGVFLCCSNIGFDISLTELVWSLTRGFRLILHEGDEGRPVISGPNSLPEQVIKYRATHLQSTPALSHLLLAHTQAATALRLLRKLTVGGEAFPPELAATLMRMVSGDVMNAYGPTEASVCCAHHRVDKAERVIPIGRGMVNARLLVLDQDGRLVPPLAPGELYVGGPIVARGYLHLPALTDERFIPDPFAPKADARLYRTGDLVRRRMDGALEFLGRVDSQVKIHGYRIELGEIETVLCRHPGVQQCVVVAHEMGNHRRLIAYFTAVPGFRPASADLRSHLKQSLPEYMLPALFICLKEIPITGSGKVNRSRLPRPEFRSAGPDDETQESAAASHSDPRIRAIESTLCGWCSELLLVSGVRPTDDFFEIGGHSIVAAQLVQRIARTYRVHMKLSGFLQRRSMRSIAEWIHTTVEGPGSESVSQSCVVPIRTKGSKTPVFFLAGVGGNIVNFELLTRFLDTDRPVFGIETLGLDSNNNVLTNVEDMARYYISELRKVQPEGPYHLLGYSFGGVVGFEMARQLRADGQPVGVMGLIDTSEFHYARRVVASFDAGQRWRVLYKGTFKRLVFGPRRWEAFKIRSRAIGVRCMFALHAVLGRSLPANVGQAEDRNFRALEAYRPAPYGSAVHLFRCVEPDRLSGPDPLRGWGGLATEVLVHEVPGQHGIVVTEPYVGALAAAIDESLSVAESALSQEGSGMGVGVPALSSAASAAIASDPVAPNLFRHSEHYFT